MEHPLVINSSEVIDSLERAGNAFRRLVEEELLSGRLIITGITVTPQESCLESIDTEWNIPWTQYPGLWVEDLGSINEVCTYWIPTYIAPIDNRRNHRTPTSSETHIAFWISSEDRELVAERWDLQVIYNRCYVPRQPKKIIFPKINHFIPYWQRSTRSPR